MRDATNTMLCWNVETRDIGLVPWPDTEGFSRAYNRYALACMSEVRTANFETRQATVLAEGMSIILRDKFPPAVVHQVLQGLSREEVDSLRETKRQVATHVSREFVGRKR